VPHRDVLRRASILAGLALAAAVVLWLAESRNTFFDLRVYHGAVSYWVHHDGMIYDWLRPGTPYGFTYPPFAAIAMVPMAVLPFALVIAVASVATVVSTAVLLWWLIPAGLTARRHYTLAVALCLALGFEPVRETFAFGQVNMLLLLLVAADLLHAQARGSRWAGVGIGLATAVKLTPGVFIVYLLVTGRWRAAATAIGTAAAVTVAAAAIAPDVSREFWTAALWNTDRVGDLAYVSNQSLRGVLARIPLTGAFASVLWLVLLVAVLGWWVWRVRAASTAGDHAAALALTGILGCLISPVTWIHHLVWVLPALVLVLLRGWSAPPGSRDRRLLWVGVAAYLLMSCRLLWVWENQPDRIGEFVFANLDVWCCLVLFALIPVRARVLSQGSVSVVGDGRS
jgi:alpha-1,2-mannosyltransferase